MAKTFALLRNDNRQEFPTCRDFLAALKEERKTVVLFIGPGCEPCGSYLNAVSSLGEQPGVSFAVMDVAECPAVARRQDVDSTPSIRLYSGVREVARLALNGDVKADIKTLKEAIDSHG